MELILIVEDDQGIRESLKEILELVSYNVIIAKDGKEGYLKIIEEKPDLVLCDVNMPELDGFELLEAVNQRYAHEIIPPFIFLTAKVEKQDIRKGMNLGAEDYILKPFEHTEVLKIIRLRLDRRKKLLESGNVSDNPTPAFASSRLALPCDEGLELVPFDDILRCEADRAYCFFHLVDNRKIIVSKSMKEFEDILLKNNFLKVHRSTIVNIKHAKKVVRGKGGYLVMSDGSSVAVSVRKKDDLMKVLRPTS